MSDTRLAAIQLEHPGWHAWRSAGGRLWATRMVRHRPDDAPDAYAMTIDAETPDELRAALAAQDGLADGPG